MVISEETKEISLVQDGKIETVANEKVLANQLETIFVPRDTQQQRWKNWFNKS